MAHRGRRERPQLTTSLRVFAGVSKEQHADCSDVLDGALLLKKRHQQMSLTSKQRSWSVLSQEILLHCGAENRKKVAQDLQDIRALANELTGSELPSEEVGDVAVAVFEVFKASQRVGKEEAQRLNAMIGPYPASVANNACAAVKRLRENCGNGHLFESQKEKEEEKEISKQQKEFGSNFPFSFASELHIEENGTGCDSLSEDDEDLAECMMQLTDNVIAQGPSRESPTGGSFQDDFYSTVANSYDFKWLQQMCKLCCGSTYTWRELYMSVFDVLSSKMDNAAIQGELMDLIGFDHFEVVGEMLENRQALVASVLDNPALLARDVDVESYSERKGPRKKSAGQPSYGCQITVQSEHEINLKKQMRKDEKKMAKKEREFNASQSANNVDLNFEELRRERELALQEAALRPILSGQRAGHNHVPPSVLYPHVYDAMSEVLLSPAVLAGAKIGIPATAVRRSERKYEEIVLPADSTVAPMPDLGVEQIKVSSLDEMARTAFQGTKSLNLIQSIVYERAYHSNENLLICAPTGSGKTNIAMLAVLRELKLHLNSEGGIKKEEFKIIYIAPMKALASEMVQNFGRRLAPLGVSVRELTGDMQLTKSEIQATQMIVTTPEKWDVVTRKGTGDVSLSQIVRLLIVDEVHLLHEDRGAVIESLVARTLRQVETSQQMIRIVGLSATLPSYLDVAQFLHVNLFKGLFFFDGRFRPVPLKQSFVGVKATGRLQQMRDMDEVCYENVLESAHKGHQVLVFVHARNATVRTATALRDLAADSNELQHFQPDQTPEFGWATKQVQRSRNKQLRDLFNDGFSIHHAGMLRQDRNLVERLFSLGLIRVLVCTATLAWGVNLPAVRVIIKGTQVYDAQKGAFVDLGVLDVLQIFGRAGRPQYHSEGEGIIITSHDKLAHYLSLITRQSPIESKFTTSLTDNLNAEVALGTVTNVEEAMQWLNFTYLIVRARNNPLAYGLPYVVRETDPGLDEYRRKLVVTAATELDKAKMIRFVESTEPQGLLPTDLGRTASHFYIKYASIETYNELFQEMMTEDQVLSMVAKSQEFDQIKVREDEASELTTMMSEYCHVSVQGGAENTYGKVNILLQSFVSRGLVDTFSLVSDMNYVSQNAVRILRSLFEIALRRGWPAMAAKLLSLSKSVDLRLWAFDHPLRQFSDLPTGIVDKLEAKKQSLDHLRDMKPDDIGHLVHHVKMGKEIKKHVESFPALGLEASIQPITRTVLRIRLVITPEFKWNSRYHGNTGEGWWIWVEDPESDHLYHSEYFLLLKKHVLSETPQELVFTIPILEDFPPQYYVRAVSDRWLGAENVTPITFKHLILPEIHPPHTNLLNLQPLPTTALKNPQYQSLFPFDYFNPIQTQIFHTMFHTDHCVLLGAPTGSGKTVAAELAILRVFDKYPTSKCVYIAPLKALVRERIEDWKVRIEQNMRKKVVELTGDVSPDIRAIEEADVIVTTPEKWDGISRSWQNRTYVQAVSLLVIDEIHMLGEDRGPVLEVIVSRTNFISSHTSQKVRVVGLSTALANARDLADWLGISQAGLFNFRPAVRPVPLETHIHGFPTKQYCPRMATMNKPAYTAICTHSPRKPVLIFVASRRQTRLTAQALIGFLATTETPKQWLHLPEDELEQLLSQVQESNLKFTLGFGIGLHHAGLKEQDRKLTESLFLHQKIQVLVATSTLAWGVNLPAHLVIIKGTEYFDGKKQHYVDFPITDVLQMMGRAGRPQFDANGVAVIFVQDTKKHFYKKFLYEPFPVESSLLQVLSDHLNAEVVAGTVTSKQDAVDYLTWTYFFRRLLRNPSYYQLEDTNATSINNHLSSLVEGSLSELERSHCLAIEDDDRTVIPLPLGCIASFYYLHHATVRMFRETISRDSTLEELLQCLCDATEYDELPVRHNEDNLNSILASLVPLTVDSASYDSPHTKAHLLLQAHFSRTPLPVVDYHTDTKTVLDQTIRILQAMLDVAANEGWLATVLRLAQLMQMVVQARWTTDPGILTLPYLEEEHLREIDGAFRLWKKKTGMKCVQEVSCLPELLAVVERDQSFLQTALGSSLDRGMIKEVMSAVLKLPLVNVKWQVKRDTEGNSQGEPSKASGIPSRDGRVYVRVEPEESCLLRVELTRTTLHRGKTQDHKAQAPRFPKPKDEGWFLVLGEVDSGELLAVKRLGFIRGRTTASLAFTAPAQAGRHIYTLYLLSDCYLSLDQQYDVPVEVE